jgi:TRAP-type C4-dicarboxylate transport system substrate-binding protein
MAGWAHLFGRQPVVYPDDLRKQKLHVQPENSEEIQAWKSMGFQVVPLPITDVLSGLQSGLTDAYAMTPLTAASLQWFALTPNMSSMNWGPMLGGIVVSQTTWRRIPDDLKPRLLEVASAQEQALRRDTDRLEQEALAVMKQYGLKIQPVPPDAVRQWQAIVDRGFDFLIGKTIDRQVYQQIEQHLEEFRGR